MLHVISIILTVFTQTCQDTKTGGQLEGPFAKEFSEFGMQLLLILAKAQRGKAFLRRNVLSSERARTKAALRSPITVY